MFEFQKELFEECHNLTNRTLDAVYFILLNGFPDVRDLIKGIIAFIEYLEELQCKLIVNLLKK